MASDAADKKKASASLQETLRKVESSVVPAIKSHVSSEEFSQKDGLDFLDVKNSLMISYLIDLVARIRQKAQGAQESKTIERLTEMRIVLDKMQGMDKKLRYQIDKLLAANTDASAFAAGTDTGPEDPLQFRPDIKALDNEQDDDGDDSSNAESTSDDGDDDGSSQSVVSDNSDGDIDDDLQAARATLSLAKESKKKSDDQDDGIYRAPRLTAVPYSLDQEHKQKEKEKRARKRLRATELAQTLRAEYGDAPEQEDIYGGSDYGKQRAAARRLAEREAEKIKYEEEAMVRLQTSRKDKKEKKRLMREEGSNLAAIADLGNLVRETRAFGTEDDFNEGRFPELPEKSSRYENGKRRREPLNIDGRHSTKRGKPGKAKNSLQAALYNTGTKAKKKSKK